VKSDSNVPQKSLFKLAWKVKELETLADNIRQLVVDIKILVERVNDHSYSLIANNVAGYLCSLRGRLTEAVKLITKHQRTEATHIFVFMISSETRNRKPYALPVQCLPIASLKDAQVRDLANNIVAVMKQKEMKVAGTIIMSFMGSTQRIKAYK
jgi:hypothetical protein